MLALTLAAFVRAAEISAIKFIKYDDNVENMTLDAKPNQVVSLDLTENQTLIAKLEGLKGEAKHAFYVLEQGTYSIVENLQSKGTYAAKLNPRALAGLYKHPGEYSLKVSITYEGEKPIMTEIAKINFIANGEVIDNFTDVEWDFQKPHEQPGAFLVFVFEVASFVPIFILLVLLLINGCNFGYFPRNFFDAIFSITFVVAFGGFLYYFIYFWKHIHFEEMLKQLCVIFPALLILLRLALIGRAKMVARDVPAEEKVKTE
ncbi:hypothetical protein TVAG_476400 [Trichomonas vaginalis G3]|uniref:Ribophorin II C-terminal domain-containing protein n=1 Tax=Trichomonas vaginalis (strain ATCC PRA-98 / G3) TaxID=412133 RepID=A2DA63_TRIV3|nr:oligosaccharyltransferase subunit ribophorin II family [Trichomonas vaginalis G3]EAY22711.1 hypothetical protein TVAG_476400 [Trichomonas vaginalis G3]KAI5525524.1 oligosaccharyltransferase subunit ribophorin II family [Trichomonas vaginalis G3]|eukprot:XP_001583697.1 hypothetical protein [Trichomonas vaginalis G3]